MLRPRVVPIAVLAAALVALSAVPAEAAVKLSISRGFPADQRAAGAAENEYDVGSDDDPSAFCRGGKQPITVGWSGATAPIAGTDVNSSRDISYFELDPRRPVKAGPIRAVAVCASGVGGKATVKRSQGNAVSCGAKLTLGLAATESWPYIETAIAVGPSGANGWSANAGPQSRASAVCVPKSAFKRLATVAKTGTFAAGTATATVSAKCTGGRRVVAWGYSAPVMAGNTWSSADTDSKRSVPFVGDAVPTGGGTGWKLTFRTPDNLPATAAAPGLGLTVRCAAPA